MAAFEVQTKCVVEALFLDLFSEDESDCRSLETDSGGHVSGEPVQAAGQSPARYNPSALALRLRCIGDDSETRFDPVVIASRLRQMGDRCNMDFERVSSEALAEVLKGKVDKFGAAVETLSRSWSDRNPELVYETVFLSVSVKLLMHVAKKIPDLWRPSHLIQVINGNAQVRKYIETHGGWENLGN